MHLTVEELKVVQQADDTIEEIQDLWNKLPRRMPLPSGKGYHTLAEITKRIPDLIMLLKIQQEVIGQQIKIIGAFEHVVPEVAAMLRNPQSTA
jgi:hypothetical protein